MSLRKTIETIATVAREFEQGYQIGELIRMERAQAMRVLEEAVQTWPSQRLDEFEATFLNASLGTFSVTERIRAMELYAYMKVLETHYYGKWRGFSPGTSGAAIH